MSNVVLVSGGMDSAVALSLAREQGSCLALTVDYGQANRAEVEIAARLAEHYHASHRIVVLDTAYMAGSCAALGGGDITHTFVPARNLLFLALAVSVAESCGSSQVWFGANADDAGYYPDCRADFVHTVSLAAGLGTQHGGVQVVAPFLEMSKRDVAALGAKRMVPLAWTTTCAAPVDGLPCGRCRGCEQREEALRG